MTHVAVEYDRTAWQLDLNTILPLDRLNEMAKDNEIGSVAEKHYTFMGAADPRDMEKSALEVSSEMKKEAVATVFLVPVSPFCTRAVCGLAHIFESQGFSTVLVGFVKEHIEIIKPPRALWLNFPMGRPLGKPNNPEFQKKVIRTAFDLFEKSSGPVLDDFSEIIPVK